MVEMKSWAVITNEVNPFLAPELGKRYLSGLVFGHPHFDDGSYVRTSAIMSVRDEGDYKVVTTRNTEYTITRENVLPEYEVAFPGAYDRLSVEL